MMASITETMTVPSLETMQVKLRSPQTSIKVIMVDQNSALAEKKFMKPKYRTDPQRILEPARKKLSTLEAQRIMSVLTENIRRTEIVAALPYILENLEKFQIVFGSELTQMLEDHRIVLQSFGELRSCEEQFRKTESRISNKTGRKSKQSDRNVSAGSDLRRSAILDIRSEEGSRLEIMEQQKIDGFSRMSTDHVTEMGRETGIDTDLAVDEEIDILSIADRKSTTNADQIGAENVEKEDELGRETSVLGSRFGETPQERPSSQAEMAGRNAGLVAEQMKHSCRNILRAFFLNPSAHAAVLKDEGLRYSKQSEEVINHLKALKDFLMAKLLTTPSEEVERAQYLREMTEKEKYNSGIIAKLSAELNAAEEERDKDIAKENEQIWKLQFDLHQIEKLSEENIRKMTNDGEKQEQADKKNSEGKMTKLQQELNQIRNQFSSCLAEHREKEQVLRKKKFQVETEVENWIQTFDKEMGERQDEYEQLDLIYTEEKRQLNELEERFKTLDAEYQIIMEERHIAREARESAERELQMCIRAATTIQAFWRSFKVRKAIKSRKKKGVKGAQKKTPKK